MISAAFSHFLPPTGPQRPVRFGAASEDKIPLGEQGTLDAADLFRRAIKETEAMPGSEKPGQTPLDRLIARLLDGDATMGRQLINGLKRVITGSHEEWSCQPEIYTKNGGQRVGYRVKVGTLDRLFKNRTVSSAASMSFEEFTQKRFGKNRVIISFTGWTKPPVEPLLKNAHFRKQLEKLPRQDWPRYAERVYIDIIKRYLNEVMANLKEELPDFNPATDLGIIYGVTPEGVDRAVQEFALKNSIPAAGLTARNWAEYIPDEAGLPDVFIAENPTEFGSLMADSSNKVVVTGGRTFAAEVKLNGESAKGSDRRIPVDLFKSYAGVVIPPVVPGEDEVSAKVVNAAALIKLLGLDPWDLEVVQSAVNGRKTNNRDAFTTTHILKQALETCYQTRELEKQFVEDVQ